MFSLICAWINGWVNNGKAGDLIHHRSHYDVIVMIKSRHWLVRCPVCHYLNQCLPIVNSSLWGSVKSKHGDVIKWKHFPLYWPFVRGIHRGPVNSTHKGQWRGALMFSLIYVWIHGWVNNRDAGDLRRAKVGVPNSYTPRAICKAYPSIRSPTSWKWACWIDITHHCSVWNLKKTARINTDFNLSKSTLIARFMGPTWGPSGADRAQVGPMLAPWTLLSG